MRGGKSFDRNDTPDKARVGIPAPYPAFLIGSKRIRFFGGMVFGALIFAAPRWIISVFMETKSASLMDMAVPAVLIFGTMFLFRWISFATQSLALAIEKTKPVLALSIASVVIFPLVLIAILWPLGLTGFWLNMPVASLASAVLGLMLLRKINTEI